VAQWPCALERVDSRDARRLELTALALAVGGEASLPRRYSA
jgi:hypothetical protein